MSKSRLKSLAGILQEKTFVVTRPEFVFQVGKRSYCDLKSYYRKTFFTLSVEGPW